METENLLTTKKGPIDKIEPSYFSSQMSKLHYNQNMLQTFNKDLSIPFEHISYHEKIHRHSYTVHRYWSKLVRNPYP